MSSKASQETKTTKATAEVKRVSAEEYYNELVHVKLFKDNNRYRDDVFVAVNGIGMIVPRGVDVKIPRKYALALKNSEKQSSFAMEYQAKLQKSSSSVG